MWFYSDFVNIASNTLAATTDVQGTMEQLKQNISMKRLSLQ